MNILLLCASLELLDLGGDNEGFNSGQQVLAAGMRCSACNRVVGFILHHLGVKGAVKLLIAVLGHLYLLPAAGGADVVKERCSVCLRHVES